MADLPALESGRPSSRLTLFWRAALVLVVPLAIGAIAVLFFVLRPHQVAEPAPQVVTDAPAPATVRAPVAQRFSVGLLYAPDLLSPEPDFSGLFASRSVDPGAVCLAMAETGYKNSGWVRSPLGGGQWECVSDVETGEAGFIGPNLPRNAIFYILRGSESRITELRLKVSLADTSDAEIWQAVLRLARPFATSAGQPADETVVSRAAAEAGASIVRGRLAYSWQKEFSALPRYNLVLKVVGASMGSMQMSEAAMLWGEWVAPIGPVPQVEAATVNRGR